MLNRLVSLSFSRLIHHHCFSQVINQDNLTNDYRRCVIADATKPLPLIISTSNVPIHLYTHELESQALKQLKILAESGIAKGFIAAMADVHVGEIDYNVYSSKFLLLLEGVGATVGTVFASVNHVSPYAVGADIGCGMIAAPIDNLTKNNFKEIWKKEIQQKIKLTIPTGHNARIKAHRRADCIISSLGQCTNYLRKQICDRTRKQVERLKLRLIM